MLDQAFALDRISYDSISAFCEGFVRNSGALCALLVAPDGALLHRCGPASHLDADSLSALAAATFASTGEMARLIGESDFDFVMQQGREHHLQLIRVGECGLLAVVFDGNTTAGMVRLHGQRLAQQLARLLSAGEDGGTPAAVGGPPADDLEPLALPQPILRDDVRHLPLADDEADQLRASLRLRTLTVGIAFLAAALMLAEAFLRH